MRFDVDRFEERAAIREFCAGMSRFDAEVSAAREQGVERWQAMQMVKEANNAQRGGFAGGIGHQTHEVDGKRDALHLPKVQSRSKKENRPMPQRDAQGGRDSGALLALRMGSGGAL